MNLLWWNQRDRWTKLWDGRIRGQWWYVQCSQTCSRPMAKKMDEKWSYHISKIWWDYRRCYINYTPLTEICIQRKNGVKIEKTEW